MTVKTALKTAGVFFHNRVEALVKAVTIVGALTISSGVTKAVPPDVVDPWRDVHGQAPSVSVPLPVYDAAKPGSWERELQWFERFGATIASADRQDNAEHKRYRQAGYETMQMPYTPSRNARERADRKNWITSYLKTPWQHKEGPESLSFSVRVPLDKKRAKVESSGYVFAGHLPEEMSVFVQEKSSRNFLPRDQWRLDKPALRVVVEGGVPGKMYRVLLLCGERFRPDSMNLDGVPPAGRRRHMEHLGEWLDDLPDMAIARPTSFNYTFSAIRPEKTGQPPYVMLPSYCWFGYQRTTTPDRLRRFEKRFGHPFDIRLMTDTCYMDPGYPPSEEMWKWMNLVREDMNGYVKDYVAECRKRGKRVRMFWGDQWIGVEPYLGDVQAGGVDEIVTALHGGPGRVRDLMSFEGDVKRFVRFTMIGGAIAKNERRHRARALHLWNQWKSEMFVDCPDGFEYLVMRKPWLESKLISSAYIDIAEDFKRVFHHVHGRERHKPMTIYVLNAWGGMRCMGRHNYRSRQLMQNFSNWSANLKFAALGEVARQGVPSDADLIVLYGEPGTAWSGGGLWDDPKLVRAVSDYVRAGGGLLCAGGGAGFHNGNFMLAELTGVEYDRAPTPYCAEELWNKNRWLEAGRPVGGFDRDKVMPVRTLSIDRAALPQAVAERCAADEIELRADCLVKLRDAAPFARADNRGVVCAVRQSGRGRVAYIGGYGIFPRLLKVLSYYLADRIDALDQLDVTDGDVLPFFYPDGNLLVVFNMRGPARSARLRFDPALAGLGDAERIALTPAEGGDAVVVDADVLRRGWPVHVEARETFYWTVSKAQ